MHQQALNDLEFTKLQRIAYAKWGIDINPGKLELVNGRLRKLLSAGLAGSVSEVIQKLEWGGDTAFELAVFDVLSTNMTSFFREAEHFECLSREVLDPLLASGERRPLRFWSAACSKGCEPYSMAMVLRDKLPDIENWDVKILASDLSQSVLAEARRGVYGLSWVDELPKDLVARHFMTGTGAAKGKVRVKPEVSKLVTFALINLNAKWRHNGPFDAIFCRNVMIYFDEPTRSKLIERLRQMIRPGGLLVLGCSEALSDPPKTLKRLQPAVYQAA